MQETMTMQEAEELARERRAAAWMAFGASLLEAEAETGRAKLAVIDDGRVGRRRRPRKSGDYGPVAA